MSSLIDEQNQFIDESTSSPIVNGYIHIGVQNQDPTLLANKITIYSDRDLTTTLSNPQRTGSDGRAINKIWVPGKYSITVQNSDSVQKYSSLDAGESPATGISNLTNVAGANTITADATPTISELTDKEIYNLTSIGANTGPVTLAIDLVPAKNVYKYHDQPLIADDIEINQNVMVQYNSTDDVFQLLNPAQISTSTTAKFAKGADIASATALALGTDGNYFDVTGTTAITSINTVGIGTVIKLHFDGILTLTHHATDLILPGGADITTAAGDEAEFIEYAAGDWRCVNYQTSAIPVIKTEIIDIGDWNMDTDFSKGVAHGLTYANIRSIEVLIRNDADTTITVLPSPSNLATGIESVQANSTQVTILRGTAGVFDNTNHDATSYNRGWVVIRYV